MYFLSLSVSNVFVTEHSKNPWFKHGAYFAHGWSRMSPRNYLQHLLSSVIFDCIVTRWIAVLPPHQVGGKGWWKFSFSILSFEKWCHFLRLLLTFHWLDLCDTPSWKQRGWGVASSYPYKRDRLEAEMRSCVERNTLQCLAHHHCLRFCCHLGLLWLAPAEAPSHI